MTELQLALRIAAQEDEVARLVYADWLEENGKAPAASYYRGTDTTPASLHRGLVAARQQRLLTESLVAYRNREVSTGYWLRQEAKALGRLGYVNIHIGDLPHASRRLPGTVYIRPSTGGRWGKSHAVRLGRPLTTSEMLAMCEDL